MYHMRQIIWTKRSPGRTHAHPQCSGEKSHNCASTERPFKCGQCNRSFNQSGPLRKHQLMHTGAQPYKCEVCDKSFVSKHHLIYHSRIHSGERPFKCGKCGKSFNQRVHLKTHQLTHTGAKPFKCEVCEKSISQSGNLKRHMHSEHCSPTLMISRTNAKSARNHLCKLDM